MQVAITLLGDEHYAVYAGKCVGEVEAAGVRPGLRWVAYAYCGEDAYYEGFKTRDLAAEWLVANANKGEAKCLTS